MKHKDKLRLARKIGAGLREHGYSIFNTSPWNDRKEAIARRVEKKEAAAKEASRLRKLRILDDKGKEHKVGELFESETVTIET